MNNVVLNHLKIVLLTIKSNIRKNPMLSIKKDCMKLDHKKSIYKLAAIHKYSSYDKIHFRWYELSR